MRQLIRLAPLLILAVLLPQIGHAQALKFNLTQQVNAGGTVTPTLTWCTEQTASAGTTCGTTGPAASCAASGGWTGTKAASGTETLAAVSKATTYTLQCSWPGSDRFTLNWKVPTTNDDGSALTDLAGYTIYYSTSASMSQNQTIDVKNPAATSQVISGLAPGTWYAVINSYTTDGRPSSKVPVPPISRVVAGSASAAQTAKVVFPGAPTGVIATD